jgi:hypothetical protein
MTGSTWTYGSGSARSNRPDQDAGSGCGQG